MPVNSVHVVLIAAGEEIPTDAFALLSFEPKWATP
jgi:hypothetical protein